MKRLLREAFWAVRGPACRRATTSWSWRAPDAGELAERGGRERHRERAATSCSREAGSPESRPRERARAVVIAPIRLYQRFDLAGPSERAASTIRPAPSTRCRRSGASAYCGARAGGLAAPALQPLEPRRRGPRRGPDPLPHPHADIDAPNSLANVLQPLIDVCERDPEFFHDTVGFSWGAVDHRADFVMRLVDPAADLQAGEVDAGAAAAPAGDEEDPGAVQGRPPADEPGDDEALPGAQGQSARLVPPAPPSAPVLHLALLHAAAAPSFDTPSVPAADGHGASFLFIPDITDRPPAAVLVVLLVLYVGTQLISATDHDGRRATRRSGGSCLALPFVFVPFIINFQAGLIVYWITTNIWTIGQQLAVRKLYPKPAPIEVSDAKPSKRSSRRRLRRQAGAKADKPAPQGGKPQAPKAAAAAAESGKDNGSGAKPPPQLSAQEEEAIGAQALMAEDVPAPRPRATTLGEAKWNRDEGARAALPRADVRGGRFRGARGGRRGRGPAGAVAGPWIWRPGAAAPRPSSRRSRPSACARWCRASSRRSALRGDRGRRARTAEEIRATVERGRAGAPDRQARLDDRRAAAPRDADRATATGRATASGSWSTRPAIASGARRRSTRGRPGGAEALDYGRPVELEPMTRVRAQVVHEYLRDRSEVETHSEGDEPERRLVVSPLRA